MPNVSTITPFDPRPTQPHHLPVPGEIGHGVLGKGSKAIYWYFVLTLLMVVATLPAVILLLLITITPQNFILIALALIPLGPAISAGLYTVRARLRSEDEGPFRAFWRGYKTNFVGVLKFWIPALIILGIIGFTLAFGGLIGLTAVYRIGLIVIATMFGAWVAHAIAITTFFNLRFSDIARLATSYLFIMPKATFGIFALLIILGAVFWYISPLVPPLLAGILIWFLYQNERQLFVHAYQNFTDPASRQAFEESERLAVPKADDSPLFRHNNLTAR